MSRRYSQQFYWGISNSQVVIVAECVCDNRRLSFALRITVAQLSLSVPLAHFDVLPLVLESHDSRVVFRHFFFFFYRAKYSDRWIVKSVSWDRVALPFTRSSLVAQMAHARVGKGIIYTKKRIRMEFRRRFLCLSLSLVLFGFLIKTFEVFRVGCCLCAGAYDSSYGAIIELENWVTKSNQLKK